MKYLDENGLIYYHSKVKSAIQNAKVKKTSELTNDSGFITGITSTMVTNALGYTPYDSENPNGYTNNIGTITGIKVNNSSIGTSGVVNITVPTDNASLSNGAGYQTASQVSTAINNALAGITGITYSVVQSLPATGEAGVIYLVSNSGTNPNIYDEYIYVNNTFEKIGTTDVDLTNYVEFSDLTTITNAEIDTIVA